MAHHKRRRSKRRRAGCLHCKPQKGVGNGWDKDPPRERRKLAESRRFSLGQLP